MSVIDLMLPLNQLLSNDPPNIAPIPIHKNGNIPETKVPTTTLSVITFSMSGFAVMISGLTALNPEGIETKIKSIPVTIVNILIKPAGVGFIQCDQARSTSKALIKNAPPSILTKIAKISRVNPSTVAIPPIKSKIPGTPRKNFEYFESKAIAFKYLPKTAYEYSTLLLTLMTTLRTETIGNTFCIIGITLSSSSPSETIT